jgi:hypothetical protein
MSLWGKYDAKAASGTGTIKVDAANSTATGASSANLADNFEVGDYLYVGKNSYVFTAISNNTIATVRSANSSTDMSSASANGDYVVSEKPLFVTFAESLDSVSVNGVANNIYGVSTAEMAGTQAGIASVTVTAAGAGFTSRPTITFGDTGTGSGATATAVGTAVTMVVGTALDSDAGTGYANGDVIAVSGGAGTAANATVTTGTSNTSVVTLTIGTGGAYTTLPTLTGAATTASSGGGSGLKVNLTIGMGDVTVTAAGNNYTSPTATIAGNTAATGTTLTINKQTSYGGEFAHAGWVRKTVGTGGRAGRVHYETLVAMSSIGGDAEDDDFGLPE